MVHRTSQFSASTSLKSNRDNRRDAVVPEQRGGSFTQGDIDYYRYDGLVPLRQDWDIRLNYDVRFVTQVEAGEEGSDRPMFVNEFAAHSLSMSGSYRPQTTGASTTAQVLILQNAASHLQILMPFVICTVGKCVSPGCLLVRPVPTW